MAHKFDPKKIEKLEDPRRLEILDPEALFRELNLDNFNRILDFGVGSGFYLPYLVKILKSEGKIFAIDLQEELLECAKNKSEKFQLSEKIEFYLVKEKEILPFSENFFDFIYLAFTFHELDNPNFTLREIRRVMIPGGKLLLIDWNKKERDMGPAPSEVFDYEEIEDYLKATNFKILKTFKNHPYVFIFLAEK